MSFRTVLAFFKNTHTQTQTGLQAESKNFYHLPFSLSEVSEETQNTLLNIVVNVRKLEKSLQPCLPNHPILLPQNSWFAKKKFLQAILQTNSRGKKKEDISTLNLPPFTMLCQKRNYKKYHCNLAGPLSPCKTDGVKSSSCKTSKTWSTFCSDPSLTPDGVPHQGPLTEILSQGNTSPASTPKTFSNMLMLIS